MSLKCNLWENSSLFDECARKERKSKYRLTSVSLTYIERKYLKIYIHILKRPGVAVAVLKTPLSLDN